MDGVINIGFALRYLKWSWARHCMRLSAKQVINLFVEAEWGFTIFIIKF